MMLSSASRHLQGLGSKFIRADRGNVIITFAIALIPIIGVIGVVVDYGRAASARSAMQAAADATALMISRDVSGLSAADITKKAEGYFKAQFTKADMTDISVTTTYSFSSGSGSKVVVGASGNLANQFMSMAVLGGDKTTKLGTSSTVQWGITRMRVALVLDNTYSMNSSSKMTEMKKAAKSLIDDLSSSAKGAGEVLISIVPFDAVVNVGTSNINAKWLDWSQWDLNESSCSSNPSKNNTKKKCEDAGKPWNTNHDQWKGCVRDRTTTSDYDVISAPPTLGTAAADKLTQFQPVRADFLGGDNCPQQITPLTDVHPSPSIPDPKKVLKDKIDDMDPYGTTNQTIGLHWGWQTLLQQIPYNAPALDPTYVYNEVIILLSDGDNTSNRTYPWNGSGAYPSQSKIKAIDDREKLLCDNIKKKFQVFTIQVNTDGTAVSNVMSYCSSGTANFFSTTTASGIADAFGKISASISKRRIAM